MTTLVTLAARDGIVMAADSRVTTVDPGTRQILEDYDDAEKVVRAGGGVGVSYWGEITIAGHRIDWHIERVLEKASSDASVDDLAAALQAHFAKIIPPLQNEFGLHVAGYARGSKAEDAPRIRHVFHTRAFTAGDIVNEDSNRERHDGSKLVPYPTYQPYLALYNGINVIPNLLFRAMPMILQSEIRLDMLSLEESIDLAGAMVDITKAVLPFYFRPGPSPERIHQLTGGQTIVATIAPQAGFRWVKRLQDAPQGL